MRRKANSRPIAWCGVDLERPAEDLRERGDDPGGGAANRVWWREVVGEDQLEILACPFQRN